MLRFCNLASGSAGNATVVEARDGPHTTRLLVDCGLSLRALDARLATVGLCAAELDAVFITHEHSDHVGALRPLVRREGLPVYLSEGTYRACGAPDLAAPVHRCQDGEPIEIGALHIEPLAVPHDAAEPLQLRCHDGIRHLAILTDLGHAPDPLCERLQGLDALMLECNHEPARLDASAYPERLKQRIRGSHGHLSNQQAAELLAQVRHEGLQCVVAAHLSAQNNTPEHAQGALTAALAALPGTRLIVAHQHQSTDWIDIG